MGNGTERLLPSCGPWLVCCCSTRPVAYRTRRAPPAPTPNGASGVGARYWPEQSRVHALGLMSRAPFCRPGVPVWGTRAVRAATGNRDTSPQQHDVSSCDSRPSIAAEIVHERSSEAYFRKSPSTPDPFDKAREMKRATCGRISKIRRHSTALCAWETLQTQFFGNPYGLPNGLPNGFPNQVEWGEGRNGRVWRR